MKLTSHKGLLCLPVTLYHRGAVLTVPTVFLDTGSATTAFASDAVFDLGVGWTLGDPFRTVYGIGGAESTYSKTIDALEIGPYRFEHVTLDFGELPINGLLGMDLLLASHAQIDLKDLLLHLSPAFHSLS